jgi:hypothetical protein
VDIHYGSIEALPTTNAKVEVFVFYFDIVGLVDTFLEHGEVALERLRRFHRRCRDAFAFGHEHSYLLTVFDNVWARLNTSEPGMPSLLLDYAGHVMRVAQVEGFEKYFGAITRGSHFYDPADRMLVGGKSFEELREQHIDATSEPHIRAASAEKWATSPLNLPKSCVWVSSEVAEPSELSAQAGFPDSTFVPFGAEFDLAKHPLSDKRHWRFELSRFAAIRPKSPVTS